MINDPFFSMNTNSEESLVFLFGSSMVAQQNVTRIDEMISQHNDSFTVFNVAYNGDTPKKRILYIDEFIELDQIPKTLNGKIDKPKIKQNYLKTQVQL